jgi:hypothetical protein
MTRQEVEIMLRVSRKDVERIDRLIAEKLEQVRQLHLHIAGLEAERIEANRQIEAACELLGIEPL